MKICIGSATRAMGKSCLAAALAMGVPAVWANTISDVSDYVILSASDSGTESSFSSSLHWQDGSAPSAGKKYLVNDNKQLRISASGNLTFAGDFLTLDTAEFLFKSTCYAYAHWIVYGGSKLSVGSDSIEGHLCGDVTFYAAADNPTIELVVPPNRTLYLDADLTSEEDVALCVAPVPNGANAVNTYVRGNNAHYAGTFAVTRGTSTDKTKTYRLTINSQDSLGAANSLRPKLTLNGTNVAFCALEPIKFGSGYDLSVSDCAYIETSTLGTSLSGEGVSETLYFGEGAKIEGSGDAAKLIFRDCATTFGEVKISALKELVGEASATLRMTRACDAAGVPLTIRGSGELDATGLAAVTVQGGRLSAGIGSGGVGRCACASLAVDATSVLLISVAQSGQTLTNDTFEIEGNLEVADGQTVRIVFDSMPELEAGTKLPLIAAANIGELGVSAFTLDNTLVSSDIAGEFSVEAIDDKNYLVFNYASGSVASSELTVRLTQDSTSFATADNWSDGQPPHSDANYVIPSNIRLRCVTDKAVFKGKSLTVEAGGTLAIGGVSVQIDDLRLQSGAYLDTVSDGTGNTLYGAATVVNDAEEPVTFRIEAGSATVSRTLTLPMAFKGDGALKFVYSPVSNKMQADPTCGFTFTGDNSGFAGSIELSQYGIYADFAGEKAMGGPAEEFSADRLLFTSGAELRVRSGYVMQDATRGVCFGDGGGSINVYAGQTLTVSNRVCGTSSIIKKGEGTLEFCGDGDGFDGVVTNSCGTLAIGSDGVFGTLAKLVCNSNALWRVGAPGGIKVPSVDAIDVTDGKLRLRSDIIDDNIAQGVRLMRVKLLTVQSATADEADALLEKIEYVPSKLPSEGAPAITLKCFVGNGGLSVYGCSGGGFSVIVR